jgi:hypothetical protein
MTRGARSHVAIPVVTKFCSECDDTGVVIRSTDPWHEYEMQCPECLGRPDVIRIDSVLALAEAIELHGWQATYDAYRAAGYTDAETRRELEEFDETAAVRDV